MDIQEKRKKIIQLDFLLQQIAKENNCRLQNILPKNITLTQYFLLSIIKNNPNCKAADIANLLNISPAAITYMIDKLYKNNWLERIRNEEDRRVVWLKLTESGEKILLEVEKRKVDLALECFKNTSDEEIDFLLSILAKVLDSQQKTEG